MKLNAIVWRTFWLMLGWLVVAMPAHAFYDPSLGRWLNRDPLGEPGHEAMRIARQCVTWDSLQVVEVLYGVEALVLDERMPRPPAELLAEGPNLYAYVGNQPTQFIDPTGEVVPIIAIGVVVARAGFLAYRYHRSLAAAAAAARAGQSIIARNRATAQAIACRAGQGTPAIRHAPHGLRPEFLPHYHPNPNVTPPHTYIWWGRQPLGSYPKIPSGHPSVP